MSDWQATHLVDLADEITVGHVGSMTKEYQDNGIPFFRSKNISEFELNWDDVKYVSRSFHEKLKKSALGPGDVVIVRTGKPGTACVIPEAVQEANCSDVVIVRPDESRLDPHYLSYFMNSIAGHQVSSRLVGAVQQHFNVGAAKQLEIFLPPIEQQRQIVSVLLNLDDKRRLNLRIIQTLEQIAQAIFKSWFVDFEPVKAKQHILALGGNDEQTERAAQAVIAGAVNLDVITTAADLSTLDQQLVDVLSEKLGYQIDAQREQLATTARHFPDQLVESELGLIPEGWEVRCLDKIANFLNGVAAQKYPVQDGEPDLPVIKIAEMRGGLSAKTGRASQEVDTKYIINNGDLLFSWSGSLLVQQWSLGQGLLNQHIFKVTSDEFPKWFCHQWVCFHLGQFQQIAADKAVTMGHIKRSHLSEAKTLVPSERLIEIGTEVIGSLLERELQNTLESGQLSKLRDVLLPKLLSGELEVNNQSGPEEAVNA